MDNHDAAAFMEALTEVTREVFMDDDIVLTRQILADDIVGWRSIS